MGYRLHYAQHYDPIWEGGFFNRDYEKWIQLFDDRFADNGWSSSEQDAFEVQRADIQGYINELKELPAEYQNEHFGNKETPSEGYTNAQIIEVMEEILLSEDDNIRLEFF